MDKEPKSPKCPNCGSPHTFVVDRAIFMDSPIYVWMCQDCGYMWTISGLRKAKRANVPYQFDVKEIQDP